MNKLFITSVLIAGLLGSPLAMADRDGPGKFMRFFDANNDGTVTLDEFNEAAKARFDRMDSDHNGVVSQEEFYNYIKQRRAERKTEKHARMDTNHDGKVTEDEYVAYKAQKAKRKFARMDKNGDGNLSVDEMKSCHGRKHGKGMHIFKRLDKNGDGQVTREESYQAWSDWFARIDTNGDKVVTTDEVNAYRKLKHAGHDQ